MFDLLRRGRAAVLRNLPRVEICDFACAANGVTADEIGARPDSCDYVRDGISVEWRGDRYNLALGDVRPRL